jgi:hypothetical protein
MSTIVGHDEKLRRAIQWISDERRARPGANPIKLAQEASSRFDLPPSAEAWLIETFGQPEALDPAAPTRPR